MSFRRSFFLTFLASSLLLAAFLSGFLVNEWRHRQMDAFPVLEEAYGLLRDHAYFSLPPGRALEYGMIRGMVQSYGSATNDPHTAFLEPPQAELESQSLAGKFGGIGVRLGKDADGNWVLYPFPDGPAATAGMLENDRLIGVDTLDVTPQTPSDTIQAAIRGPEGQKVTIRVARPPSFDPLEFTIERQEIALPSVTWHLHADEPRLGMIEVNIIADPTAQEIQNAVSDLTSRGATAFALDLRNNGGGLVDSGIEIARLFLEDGVIMQEQYRGAAAKTYAVDRPGPLAGIRLVVLINGGTASAAEIVAGALQAHHRALLIGEPTYGKNTIQSVYELQDHSTIHITAAQWWLPGLDAPKPGKGLTPDLAVAAGDLPDAVVQAAVQSLFGAP